MINRRFNKRQRLIKQKVTLRLPRFHRIFLGARSLGTDNSGEIANSRSSFWLADRLKADQLRPRSSRKSAVIKSLYVRKFSRLKSPSPGTSTCILTVVSLGGLLCINGPSCFC